MKILITGANGFVGRRLAERICELGGLGNNHPPMTRLTLLSRKFQNPPHHSAIVLTKGDIAERKNLEQAVEGGVDCVFHIASITSGDAERDFDLGRKVNLDGTCSLFELMRNQRYPPVVVFSSSIAVYGRPLPDRVDDDTQPLPSLSYGAQKLIGEILLADYSRRGFFDGRALRLPGVVARPKNDGSAFSLFLSNIFHSFAEGDPEFVCPISPDGTPWLMSLECCVENLLHAARLPADKLPDRRAWTIPTLRVRMDELAAALRAATGSAIRLIYQPTEPFESAIGHLPELSTPLAQSLGFKSDGNVQTLVSRVLAAIQATAMKPVA